MLAMNAVCGTPVEQVALDREAFNRIDRTFSVHLPENKATHQKASGRCWLFAALNTFRPIAIQAMNLEPEFELSQNYLLFWDKLEKANYFLENILATLDEPIGTRLLDHLLQAPIQDGGQWHMFVNLVKKYGVVPKRFMPETDSSSSTGRMNGIITGQLRAFACALRDAYGEGDSHEALRERKEEMVGAIYRMLAIHLGEPPREFEWQWRDKDKEFHRAGTLTPQEFYDKYIGVDLDSQVCLIHDPRPLHRTMRSYTVKFLGNVVGGEPILYVNVDAQTMKKAAIAQLQAGSPVWFGCDVGKFLLRKEGVMDQALFDFRSVYGIDGGLTKAERLQYGESMMTHAMVFTGVDLNEKGEPTRWRVENSWSDENGDKGFFQMSDAWFDEFMYEVVVDGKYLEPEVLEVVKQTPIELDPWDPMGSLA